MHVLQMISQRKNSYLVEYTYMERGPLCTFAPVLDKSKKTLKHIKERK